MAEPVDVAALKAALDIVRDDQDDYLESLITAGREYVEQFTGLKLVAGEVTDSFDRFCTPLELHAWPVANDATAEISYVDASGAAQSVSDYRLRVGGRPARLWPLTGSAWPVAGTVTGAVSVTYTAGYEAAADVPQALKHAIIVYVRLAYDTGLIDEQGEWAVQALARPYRLPVIG